MKHISIYSSARYAASRMQRHITWGQMEGIQIALPQTSQSSVELRTGRSAERASVTNKSDDDTSVDKSCRYILGKPSKMGDNIIVIAANPSKAGLAKTDSTMDNIAKTVNHLGAKGYAVLNLCLFGVAIPISCQLRPTKLVMDENMRAFADVLAKPYMKDAKVWAAWGGLIEKRPYMAESLRRIVVATFKKFGHQGAWFQMGESTTNGHPRHPSPRIKKPELLPWNMHPTY